MTEEQERVLVNTVERLTVEMQQLAVRSWETLGTVESRRIQLEAAALNLKLVEAFPYLRFPAAS